MGTANQQPVSLRDELANSYDEQASAEAAEESTATPAPDAGAQVTEQAPPIEGSAADMGAEAKPEEDEEQEEVQPGGAAAEAKPKLPGALETPKHWKAEDKEKLSKLPEEAKQILLRRHKEMETDYIRKTQELAVKSKDIAVTKQFKDNVESLFTPYRQLFATQGLDEVGGVRYLLGWFSSLQQNPEQTIMRLAHDYGVEFTPKPGQQVNPELAPLIGEIQTLKTRIAQNDQAQQAAVSSSILQQVTSFAQETDAEGNPKYPHFETVRGDMAVFIQTGRASDLEEAYGMAVRLRPEIHDELLKESILGQQKTTQQQELDEAARKAAQAKKAAKGVRSGSANVEKTQPKSIRDDLSDAYDQQAAR
jgi:hypothetical protein